MNKNLLYNSIAVLMMIASLVGCNTAKPINRTEDKTVPASYNNSQDTVNIATINWKEYFTDPNLIRLIEIALENNQELNIILQEIEIDKNEVKARKGEYLPFVGLKGAAGLEKEGEYTRHGAVEEQLHIKHGKAFPEPLPDYMFGAVASWELDVWKKLRNGKKAAVSRYLASVEGKNFMVTNLISEVSLSYYELMALDNMLEILERNNEIQENAVRVIKQQKEAARVTQLAVNRFEAQLLNTQNLVYNIRQQITETENRIHFLTGSFGEPIQRNSGEFMNTLPVAMTAGIPSQLLQNRPDIRQAEMELMAAKLDVKAARADFYPSFTIEAETGFQAFNLSYLLNPESLLYNLAGEVTAPLINRNAIKAAYNSASARQLQSIYNYEQSILSAYLEVQNQISALDNYTKSFQKKAEEVEKLKRSVAISNNLFRSARADYLEVLLTQREALDSRMELVEIKLNQLSSTVNTYKALGGGWQ